MISRLPISDDEKPEAVKRLFYQNSELQSQSSPGGMSDKLSTPCESTKDNQRFRDDAILRSALRL